MANRTLFGKTTSPEGAHATYRVDNSSNGMYFEWRVLKTYQSKDNEDKNPYARWYCAVKSPYTHDRWEYGDTYIKDIMSVGAKLIKSSGKWREQYNDDLMYDVADNLKKVGLNVVTDDDVALHLKRVKAEVESNPFFTPANKPEKS